MNEKCASHDDGFKRIHERLDKMFEGIEHIKDDIHRRLGEGEVRFKELEMRIAQYEKTVAHAADVRSTQLEMRIAQCEKALAERSSGRSDAKQKMVAAAIDILKLGIISIAGAAVWAFANGYKV